MRKPCSCYLAIYPCRTGKLQSPDASWADCFSGGSCRGTINTATHTSHYSATTVDLAIPAYYFWRTREIREQTSSYNWGLFEDSDRPLKISEKFPTPLVN